MEKEYTIFDKKNVYNKEIEPLVDQIRGICAVNNIPFFISFAIANENEETAYKNDGNLTGSNGITLYDDKFKLYLMATRGAKLMPIGKMSSEMEAKLAELDFYEDDEEENV